MVDATYIDNGRLQIVQNSDISFDTDRPSITLFPDSYRIVQTRTITFPSLLQARAYYRAAYGGGAVCELWSTLFWQEWGPDEGHHNENWFPANPSASIPGPTTRNLPREYIGSVPAAANHLDIRVKLNRTTTPPAFLGISPPVIIPPVNQEITLPGGSCPLETFGLMKRMFNIVRIGNDIYLERYQSVVNSNTDSGPGGHAQSNISVNQSGWNSSSQKWHSATTWSDGTPIGSLSPRSNTELAILLVQKGPLPSGQNRRPGGSDPCNQTAWPDLTSIYSADIKITPGMRKP
jgi:hypothetical protein